MFKSGNTILVSMAFLVELILGTILFVQFSTNNLNPDFFQENNAECVDFSMEDDFVEELHIANPCPPALFEKTSQQGVSSHKVCDLSTYHFVFWQPPKHC